MLPPFVAPAWLRGHLDDVVLADVRWFLDGRDGHAAYRAQHLPGAVFVDLDVDLAAPATPMDGRHPLPEPDAFAAAMGRLGIGDDATVVAYDQGSGAIAARLVWMLRALGRDAAVLAGGVDAWGGPWASGTTVREPATFTARPWPADLIADADAVAHAAAGDGIVIDARAPERYRGEVEPVDPRPGHVPGAVNLPYTDNLDPMGLPLPPARLRERFESAGVTDDRDVIVYCGSGVTACHDVLALESVGFRARLFPGSWSAWSNDPARPVATGPDPGGQATE